MKIFFIIMVMTMILNLIMLTLTKISISDKEKFSLFECGFDPYSITRIPFSLKFFKLTIIFLIFDIEIILILPLSIINNFNMLFFNSSYMIIIIIMLGLIYEWYEGSLNWIN